VTAAHRPRFGDPGTFDSHPRRGVRTPAWLESLEVAEDAVGSFPFDPVGLGVVWHRQRRRLLRGTRSAELVSERFDLISLHFKTCGRVMPAERHEDIAAGHERIVHRESCWAARRSSAHAALETHDNGGLARHRGQPSRDDSYDSLMPTLSGHHDRRKVAERWIPDLGQRIGHNAPLDLLASRGTRVYALGQPLRVDGIGSEQEIQRQLCSVDTPWSVDSRCQAKRNILAGRRRACATSDLDKRPSAFPPSLRYHAQSRSNECPVVTIERRDVGHRSKRHEIQPGTHIEIDTELGSDTRSN
jgi:hypothetical protein